MSLADELSKELIKPTTTTEWIEQWVASLNANDRKTWDAWLADPNKPAVTIFRVIRRHGYPRASTTWRGWLREYRESLG